MGALPRTRRLPWKGSFGVVLFLISACSLRAQEPIDYSSQIAPIFVTMCTGGACHGGAAESGVELSSYDATMASFGVTYGELVVVPFDSAASVLWKKIAEESPERGVRMPKGEPPLFPDEIDLIARWIDEGARESGEPHVLLRGDLTHDDSLDISDAVSLLAYLFLGGIEPYCEPVADANSDSGVDLSDAVFILSHLFLGGAPPLPLQPEELDQCTLPNRPPRVSPIGTIEGREDIRLSFDIEAHDVDRDSLSYAIDRAPEGLSVDFRSGRATWTPHVGQAGDHRVRIRVSDDGEPSRSAWTTGLVRVRAGNRPPLIDSPGTVYGRETVPLTYFWTATDGDGDELMWELVEAPGGSTIDAESGRFDWTPEIGQAGSHEVRVRARDDGDPARSMEASATIVVVPRDAAQNQAPFVRSRPVYRSYPEFPISFVIGATDPDGDALTFNAEDLPDGASLDATSGQFTWTPGEDDLGPVYLPIRVTDSGTPPLMAESLLIFRISPLDSCARPDCQSDSGCEELVAPVEESCCEDGSSHRVAEPIVSCPEGRVLHIGRNSSGFGRLQNCDALEVTPLPQGGHNVRLNVEARCVDSSRAVAIRMRLETSRDVLVDEESLLLLRDRRDGFAQQLHISYPVNRNVPSSEIEGAGALLTCVLTDRDGVQVERRLRLELTRDRTTDLPEPDVADVPASEVGCVGCHRPLTERGERHGIEDAHPWYPLTCTECHGGDAGADTRLEAHVAPVDGKSRVLDFLSSDELDAVDPDYLRFVNPGDLRAATAGCGASNPANPGGGCHQDHVDNVRLSLMATYAGHYKTPRYLAGTQDRGAYLGAVDVVDPDFDPDTAPEGAVPFLVALREPSEIDRGSTGGCIDIYLPKSCPTCHLNAFGPNNSPGNYRSSGCSACHMLYDEDGLSKSDDPMIDKDFPTHAWKHKLTAAIPTEQCAHCHFQGGRIGLAYRGIREGGFPPDKTPPNAVAIDRTLHAHEAGYYFTDEDETNDIDETPPDAHFSAGMTCMDCHIGGDVHGDGNIHASERDQVGVRCEDCHGTVRAEIREDPNDGLFKTEHGFALRRIRRAEGDRILLRLATEDRELEIPQVKRIVEGDVNHAMQIAMGVHENGFSHTDSLECYSCHTSWRQTCFGCHVTVDDRATGPNRTTGKSSIGAISVSRDDYSTDYFVLGTNARGKITPLCNSMSVFVTFIDENGVTQFRERTRTSREGRLGFGWNPFHHHTVSRVPQNCDRCHPVSNGPDNAAVLSETYGFGNGRYLQTDGAGVLHDLSAFLDPDGELIGDFPHPNTGPVAPEIRQRAMSTFVTPQPRQ